MVRGKPIDVDIKQLIITEHKKMGKPYQQISSSLGISRSTVHNVIKRFDESMNIDTKSKCGPPRKTDDNDDLSLRLVVMMNPHSSLVDIKRKWETQIQKDISMTTFRRRYEELGIELPKRPPFQTVREPEISIYAEEDKAPQQRPESSLLEEHSLEAESIQENIEERYQEQQPRQKKSKKSRTKNHSRNSSTIQATLDSLQTVTKAISSHHDEFSLFGEYMAMSLRTMPMRNALRCKEKLLSVIVNERLNIGSEII